MFAPALKFDVLGDVDRRARERQRVVRELVGPASTYEVPDVTFFEQAQAVAVAAVHVVRGRSRVGRPADGDLCCVSRDEIVTDATSRDLDAAGEHRRDVVRVGSRRQCPAGRRRGASRPERELALKILPAVTLGVDVVHEVRRPLRPGARARVAGVAPERVRLRAATGGVAPFLSFVHHVTVVALRRRSGSSCRA